MAIDWKNIDWLKTYKERVENLNKEIKKEHSKRIKDLLKLRRLQDEKKRLDKLISVLKQKKD